MRIYLFAICSLALCPVSVCQAQGRQPAVSDVYKEYDSNQDGVLDAKEVAGSRYARQFPRWDVNRDNKVSSDEVIAFRRKFGIAADGTLLKSPQRAFVVPEIDDLKRVTKGVSLPREDARNSAFLLATEEHPVDDSGYVILTDHVSPEFIEPLQKLAVHHDGQLVVVPDLALLHQQADKFAEIQDHLRKAKVRYVGIAPRLESFRENMVLGIWELLTTLDSDPQVDAFPGFLVASDAKAFSRLIDQSLAHDPISATELKPIAVSQVLSDAETRSLQKAAMLRKYFRGNGVETPVVAVYGKNAKNAPRLDGKQVWNLAAPGGGKFIESFSPTLANAFAESNLIIMHGHGVPGMSCSVDVQGIPDDLRGKVLMTGSCFSASPVKSDLPEMREAPGGYSVQKRDAFILRAIDQGAVVAFGHQRLSSGFPHLYPVLDSWLQGQTVGEGYQQLLNGLIMLSGAKSGDFVIREPDKRPSQNLYLYVVIGDPALQPFSKRTDPNATR
ncbi:MAG: hypothetical protein OSA98_13780 [Rubripirellula sp.]|nr:hypothetical protein [Rubripirellula sp.]